MADTEWDAEDFEPAAPVKVPVVSDKWEGEDEEEPVKESWEDEEDDEKKSEDKKESTQAQKKKPQKRLEEKLAEKKAKEESERMRREEESRLANLTPEEKLAEKLRRQKLQEESDLALARETFGVSDGDGTSILANPRTKEEFAEFRKDLLQKLAALQTREPFNEFVEEFIKELCAGLDVEVLKKVSTVTKSLHEEKLKMAKAATKGGKKGGKTKVVLKMDKGMDYLDDDYGGGEFDDFM